MSRASALFAVIMAFTVSAFGQTGPAEKEAEKILQSYVEDFRRDPAAAEPITFGVRVRREGGGEWHVVVSGRKSSAGDWEVALRSGLPPEPVVLYWLDLATLRKIDRGELNAMTAMAQARSSDPTPMGIEFMPGIQPDEAFFSRFIPFTFHFWTRGFPEIVPFGSTHTRHVHGADGVVFYYQKGLRSGWYQLTKGQHANKEPRDQTNVFPFLVVATRGSCMAKIGGKEFVLTAGQTLFVPPGVSHEWWNPNEEPFELVIVMFGEGA